LTVASVTIDLNKNKENRKTSSRSSDRPPPAGDGADEDYDTSDLGQSDAPGHQGERPSPDQPGDGPDSFDPEFMPDEPDQPDWSSGPI
jgi:hypothetical protein